MGGDGASPRCRDKSALYDARAQSRAATGARGCATRRPARAPLPERSAARAARGRVSRRVGRTLPPGATAIRREPVDRRAAWRSLRTRADAARARPNRTCGGLAGRGDRSVPHRHANRDTAPFSAKLPARSVDEDASHQPRGDAKKMCAILPIDVTLIDELQVRLVDESGCLEHVLAAFAREIS